jgi:hypothetical protein
MARAPAAHFPRMGTQSSPIGRFPARWEGLNEGG